MFSYKYLTYNTCLHMKKIPADLALTSSRFEDNRHGTMVSVGCAIWRTTTSNRIYIFRLDTTAVSKLETNPPLMVPRSEWFGGGGGGGGGGTGVGP